MREIWRKMHVHTHMHTYTHTRTPTVHWKYNIETLNTSTLSGDWLRKLLLMLHYILFFIVQYISVLKVSFVVQLHRMVRYISFVQSHWMVLNHQVVLSFYTQIFLNSYPAVLYCHTFFSGTFALLYFLFCFVCCFIIKLAATDEPGLLQIILVLDFTQDCCLPK